MHCQSSGKRKQKQGGHLQLPSEESEVLACLENELGSLERRCSDVVSLARDHLLSSPGHSETEFNMVLPGREAECQSVAMDPRVKGCHHECVRSAREWSGRRRVQPFGEQCANRSTSGVVMRLVEVTELLPASATRVPIFKCCAGSLSLPVRAGSLSLPVPVGEEASSYRLVSPQTLFPWLSLFLVFGMGCWHKGSRLSVPRPAHACELDNLGGYQDDEDQDVEI